MVFALTGTGKRPIQVLSYDLEIQTSEVRMPRARCKKRHATALIPYGHDRPREACRSSAQLQTSNCRPLIGLTLGAKTSLERDDYQVLTLLSQVRYLERGHYGVTATPRNSAATMRIEEGLSFFNVCVIDRSRALNFRAPFVSSMVVSPSIPPPIVIRR